MTAADGYRELGEAAWSWVLDQVRGDDGPWLPDAVPEAGASAVPPADRDSLYSGIAGLAPVLAEISLHRPLRDDEQALADAVVERLTTEAAVRTEPSLYFGLAGNAVALRLLAPGAETAVLARLAELVTPAGWPTDERVDPVLDGPLTDVVLGTAGVVLTAVWTGGEHSAAVASAGCDALLGAADGTPAGLDWGMVPGKTFRSPNFSHGTAGISAALAVAGTALGRSDCVDAAVKGARHLLSVGSLADDGFLVPTAIPAAPDVEKVTFTWCHGAAGTSHLFTALRRAGVAAVSGHPVDELRRRCLHSVLTSGIPQRLRPGFWDNDGRCCGTAGVGDVLLDAAQDGPDPARADELLAAAVTMADALVDRAVRDDAGARWRFVEHRIEQPLLPPGTSWMQGAAGIAAFLLRLARVLTDGRQAPVVDRPDQWWAVPASLRTVHVAS